MEIKVYEVKEILSDKKILNKNINISGWIKYRRTSKIIGFLTLVDGTNIKGIQIVFKKEDLTEEKFADLVDINLYAPINLTGTVIKNHKDNSIEILLKEFKILNNIDNDFILGKKEHGLDFLRDNAHIRSKTSLFQAVMKIRSYLHSELIAFFTREGFYYVSAPIITSNDAEGAGETFKLVRADNKPFFSNKSGVLSVSGQLHAESYAQALGKVFTFAPTFRAENSNTTKHAAEFWMLEPEIAFKDYHYVMELSERMIKEVVGNTLEKGQEEFDVLEKKLKLNLKGNLKDIIKSNFEKVSYKDVIDILLETQKNKKIDFEEKNIHFGMDLKTEHERYLAEKHFNKPVYVYDFPFKIKSFYMYRNDDKLDTVRGFDLLVPGIGELIGGSQREENYDKLMKSLREKGIDSKELEWYLNLRKSGYAPSSGFGLGFERLVMFVTGMENIRDVIPFPRTPGKLMF